MFDKWTIGTLIAIILYSLGCQQSDAQDTPLYNWWSASQSDNRASSDMGWSMHINDIEWRGSHIANGRSQEGYSLYRLEGLLFAPARFRPEGTVPIYTWYSEERGDYFTTSHPDWSANVERPLANYLVLIPNKIYAQIFKNLDVVVGSYRLVGFEGYIHDPHRPKPPRTIPIFSWWNEERQDNLTSSDPSWSVDLDLLDDIARGEHVEPPREGYRFSRLEGYVSLPGEPFDASIRAFVSDRHGSDYSRAAVNIESQFGSGEGQIDLSRGPHRLRMHSVSTGGVRIKPHYQGIGVLRDVTLNEGGTVTHVRRSALSYNHNNGLTFSAGELNSADVDGIVAFNTNGDIRFKDRRVSIDIIDEPALGNHSHPGGMQAHGDMVAIGMEQAITSDRAAVYFVEVNGLEPRFVTSLVLGEGGAPGGLDLNSTAAAGFVKLENGFLVAASGAQNGVAGIWFYRTFDTVINSETDWHYLDFWFPNRLANNVCDTSRGRHTTSCYVGAGGGVNLVANDDGRIYLIVMTGTADDLGKDDEYAQLYEVTIGRPSQSTQINLRPVWSGKKKLGWAVKNQYSFRWSGAVQTTQEGKIVILNSERSRKEKGSRNETDGIVRVAR